MSKKTIDQKAEAKQPAALKDDELDGISGGPHFRTWYSTTYDYHGEAELDPGVEATRTIVKK